MSTYYDLRKNYRYYKYVRSILGMVSLNANSILDVGSNGVDVISWLPCKAKVSVDLENPLKHDGVESIKADFITYKFKNRYDIVTCFQVLEHVSNEKIVIFAKKLLELGRVVVVSVPHMWPKGACEGHLQDPVDYNKIVGWFGQAPVFVKNIVEDTDNYRFGRMICVFLSDGFGEVISELNTGEFSSYENFALENHYKKMITDYKFLSAKFDRICCEWTKLLKAKFKDDFYNDFRRVSKPAI